MKPSSFAARCGASLLCTVTAACSLVGFDGFVGPAEGKDDGGGDGHQVDVSAPPRRDGGSNGLGGDGGDEAEGDSDAPDPNGPPVFVDGGSFCSENGGTAFCDDFDTADLSKQWLREGVFGKLTSYSPKSAPNVFLIDAPPTTAAGTFVSKITRSFETSATNVVVGFDFKPERTNEGSSFLILAALEWARADSKYSLRLVYSNGNVRLEESNLVPPPNNKDAYHPFFNLPLNQWSRVTLDVVASGSSPGVQIALDGVAVGVREPIAPTPGLDPRPTLLLGAVFAGTPHTGWRLRYDNVTATFR